MDLVDLADEAEVIDVAVSGTSAPKTAGKRWLEHVGGPTSPLRRVRRRTRTSTSALPKKAVLPEQDLPEDVEMQSQSSGASLPRLPGPSRVGAVKVITLDKGKARATSDALSRASDVEVLEMVARPDHALPVQAPLQFEAQNFSICMRGWMLEDDINYITPNFDGRKVSLGLPSNINILTGSVGRSTVLFLRAGPAQQDGWPHLHAAKRQSCPCSARGPAAARPPLAPHGPPQGVDVRRRRFACDGRLCESFLGYSRTIHRLMSLPSQHRDMVDNLWEPQPIRERLPERSPAQLAVRTINDSRAHLPFALTLRRNGGLADDDAWVELLKALVMGVKYNLDDRLHERSSLLALTNWLPTVRALTFLMGAVTARDVAIKEFPGDEDPMDDLLHTAITDVVTDAVVRFSALATYSYMAIALPRWANALELLMRDHQKSPDGASMARELDAVFVRCSNSMELAITQR